MLLSLFSSLSEKESIAVWCCFGAFWLFWILRDWWGGKYNALSTTSLQAVGVPKVVFAREVICWCMQHLGLPKGRKTGPRLLLRYYRHRKLMGTYHQSSKTITLYWGSHASLREVVNTLIHEYQHFLDIRTSQEDRAYDKELKQIGYQDVSYEKRARQVADRWEKACFQDLAKKGLLK
uniref:hypothetical protein n=1 Tax=Algoriphagus sp. TaxID=1872435 RepID=UPI0040480F4A